MKAALFIDDDVIFNHIHEALAQKASIAGRIYVANSAISALVLLQELAGNTTPPLPEVIFLDLMMPVMDGFEFLEEFEKLPDNITRNIKIVVLTSSLQDEDRVRAMKNKRVAAFANKPLKMDALTALKERLSKN
jgi:CheY-like chemotaxis protein